jgi:hypothetical protein
MDKNTSVALYKERTLPSLSFLAATLFIPLALFVIALPFSEVAGLIAAMLSLTITWIAVWISSPVTTLRSEYFQVDKARIETKFLGSAQAIQGVDVFNERGPLLDARAFTRFQFGVKQLVKVEIVDDLDPTPYWLIATRSAEVLAASINKR